MVHLDLLVPQRVRGDVAAGSTCSVVTTARRRCAHSVTTFINESHDRRRDQFRIRNCVLLPPGGRFIGAQVVRQRLPAEAQLTLQLGGVQQALHDDRPDEKALPWLQQLSVALDQQMLALAQEQLARLAELAVKVATTKHVELEAAEVELVLKAGPCSLGHSLAPRRSQAAGPEKLHCLRRQRSGAGRSAAATAPRAGSGPCK